MSPIYVIISFLLYKNILQNDIIKIAFLSSAGMPQEGFDFGKLLCC